MLGLDKGYSLSYKFDIGRNCCVESPQVEKGFVGDPRRLIGADLRINRLFLLISVQILRYRWSFTLNIDLIELIRALLLDSRLLKLGTLSL